MRALIPFKVEDAKSRLATILSPSERSELAR
ncbi:MAG: 2-phospho-L-lactate guanylyltransferase, partial [Methermicoccaceae archaeon]